MRNISDAAFMEILADFGPPDFYMAEYFRIHEHYEFEKSIMKTIVSRPGGRPVCAQFMGGDELEMARAAARLSGYPEIKMLDLNLGCPIPKIYRKNVGGGLLRDPGKIKSLIRALRSEWGGCLSVKMRLGFENPMEFPKLLDAVLENPPDFITVHARTVRQLYRGSPDYEYIAYAVRHSDIPIIANGDIVSCGCVRRVLDSTACAGVMCGRQAVRNPWIFRQIGEMLSGRGIFKPTLGDVRLYIDRLCRNILKKEGVRHADSVLKKFLNFVGPGIDSRGEFLRCMRRAGGILELMKVCDSFLLKDSSIPFADVPYPGLCSRPNLEDVYANEAV